MEKSPDAFRTISEAAEELSLPQHVLRFWETRFATIKPLKRGGGRRYYRPEDVLLLKGIRHLLYDQGFTIKGVQRILKQQGARFVIGIGEGNPVGTLAKESADGDDEDEDVAALPAPASERGTLAKIAIPPAAAVLDTRDREKLAGVMRELLDCKRLLERAREG
jgi:DNA-binding transcriptional MerR regulator